MASNRIAFALLAAACISAAAGGGYLASRQNATTAPVAAASAPASAPSAATVPAQPVQETEAVVGERGDKSLNAERPPVAASMASSSSSGARVAAPVGPAAQTRRPSISVTSDASARSAISPRNPARTDGGRQAATRPNGQLASAPVATTPQPSPISPTSAAPAGAADPNPGQTPRADDRAIPESPRAPEPQVPTFEELVVSSDSVIGLQTENTVTSESARIEDRVDARVTRDVRVGDRVAIPAGTRMIGSVTLVERGGKFKERARLGIRFHTLVLADGTRMPISTETITRDGDAPTSAAKIGGAAVGGAIIGAILGGAKGAAIGGATGAGAGAAATAAGDRNAAKLIAGTQTTVRILSPVTVTVER